VPDAVEAVVLHRAGQWGLCEAPNFESSSRYPLLYAGPAAGAQMRGIHSEPEPIAHMIPSPFKEKGGSGRAAVDRVGDPAVAARTNVAS